jgi:hypothetical protein
MGRSGRTGLTFPGGRGKEGRRFFLKKRTKRLLRTGRWQATGWPPEPVKIKSFLLLFFKKEALPYFCGGVDPLPVLLEPELLEPVLLLPPVLVPVLPPPPAPLLLGLDVPVPMPELPVPVPPLIPPALPPAPPAAPPPPPPAACAKAAPLARPITQAAIRVIFKVRMCVPPIVGRRALSDGPRGNATGRSGFPHLCVR